MISQGWAKAPDKTHAKSEEKAAPTLRDTPVESTPSWRVWEQVIVGEILNVLERRRYDQASARQGFA